MPSTSIDSAEDIEGVDLNSPSSPPHQPNINRAGINGTDFPSDEVFPFISFLLYEMVFTLSTHKKKIKAKTSLFLL